MKWLVVYALNRFARNSHDHLATRALLLSLGVSLRSVTEEIDESSQGKFMESIMAAVSQLDNDVRAERTVAGMKAAIQAGRWTFKAPLGYHTGTGKRLCEGLRLSDSGSPSLIPDPERGPMVRLAFELYATGLHTKQKVLEMVTAAGLRTLAGKPVAKQTFDQMLRKSVYAGWLTVKSWGENKRGNFEPLVNQELFDSVQALLRGKRVSVTPRLRSHPDFPLRHFVKCGCCGRPLTASWSKGRSKRYAFYFCPNSHCRGVCINRAKLESRFVAHLERMQPETRYVKLFNEIVLDVWKEKQAQNLLLSTSLREQIEELRGRKDRLIDLRTDREIAQEDFQPRLDKLNEEILLAEMKEREVKLEAYDVEGVLAFAEHVILNAARLWTEFSSDQKERLQKVLFPEGVRFAIGEFKTTAMCPLFKHLETPEGEKSGLATLSGIEPEPLP